VADTTTPDVQGDAGSNDWEARYRGLQSVLNKRTDELGAAKAAHDSLRAQYEGELAELAQFRARHEAEGIEARERAEFERLRGVFEEEPPTPRGQNASREFRQREEPFDAHTALDNIFNG
jgi:hypothetical protein